MSRSVAAISANGAAEVDRPGPARASVRPRHAALDREVDLERARAVPVAAVGAGDPRRQPVAEDVGDRAGREVEERRRRRAAVRGAARTRTPVSILPPRSASSAASASVIDREPPSATGHPCRWPAVMMPSPIADVSGRCSGRKACAATPPNSARACSVREQPGDRRAGQQRRAGRSGPAAADGVGTCSSGPMMSSVSVVEARRAGRTPARQRRRPAPSPAAVSVDRTVQHTGVAVVERVRAVDLGPPPAQPVALQAEARAGRASRRAIGWKAEQWSCSRPGRIASLVRVPPPISSAASSTVTCDARAGPGPTAAASPFGPLPTTIAVLMPIVSRSRRSRPRVLAGGLGAPASAGAGPGHVGGIGPFGSQGCSPTASATFQVPRSITPRAASITL